jgi:phage regulator Rha-like protein
MFNELTLIRKGENYYIDSREVAVLTKKPHNDLMKAIRKFCDYLTEGKLSPSDFFVESSYFDSTGRNLPCYLLSKMGCEAIALKLSGRKGALFTAAYVSKFNMMEAQLRAEWENSQKLLPTLSERNDTAKIVIERLKRTGVSTNRILDFLDELYKPLGIEVTKPGEFGNIPQTYSAIQVAYICGVYSLYGNPHSQAISCVLNEHLILSAEHKVAVYDEYTSGLTGGYRYDEYALEKVRDWFRRLDYPGRIYSDYRTYYVVYRKV